MGIRYIFMSGISNSRKIYFFKCQSVKNFGVFSNVKVSSPKMSQNKVLTMLNDNPKRLFPCLAIILSLPIAKHCPYLVGFKQ